MAILNFKASELKRVVDHALAATKWKSSWTDNGKAPRLWLVGDQGVYLMSNGDPADKISDPDKPTKLYVVYAEGCNPNTDPFDVWYGNKREWFGGDDGSESLDWCEAVKVRIDNGEPTIRIRITSKSTQLL